MKDSMSEERQQLEQRLLQDPFDSESRYAYAELLETDGHHLAAVAPW